MLYYKFKVTLKNDNAIPATRCEDYVGWVEEIKEKTITFNEKFGNDPFTLNQFFVSNTSNSNTLIICAIFGYRCKINLEDALTSYVKELGYEIAKIENATEISIHDFATNAHRADGAGFIADDDEILEDCAIGSYRICRSQIYDEFFANEDYSEAQARKEALKTNCNTGLTAELDKIYASSKQDFVGNPVHYILYCDDPNTTKTVTKILTSALYNNGRLKSRRVAVYDLNKIYSTHLSFFDDADEITDLLERLIHFQKGGALVIEAQRLKDSDHAKKSDVYVEQLARLINQYKVTTLSIVVLNKTSKAVGESLKNHLPKVRFVEIEEENFSRDTAIELLKDKAAADGIENTTSLIDTLTKDNKAYNMKDVNDLYGEWLNDRLCNEIYTQYKDIKRGQLLLSKPEGDAYTELQSLIGLNSAKEIVQQALDFNKAQILYKRAGLNDLRPSRHMVFTGNPGTAKTTVARLFAQILKDNKVLDKGNLIEVGRKDLVGKYVGWTAKLVEEAFLNARGSVLFIDEAYSLCEERNGLYGDEAINTIVQMMENQRDDTIVIFAGYPEEMNKFLDKNPGLRSRIAFNVNFDNYNTDELIQILKLIASKNNTLLAEDVVNKVAPVFEAAQKDPSFGNGRFVRNLFEQAKMKQATRLIHMDSDNLTDKAIRTLTAEDFSVQNLNFQQQQPKPLGFAC